jgi:hypothetical protein
MNRLAQEALIAGLAGRLVEKGSWCGETHIQKSTYILHELFEIPFEFDFILYKHGPYSFELHDELASMRADRLIERVPQGPKYGPRLLVTERGKELEARFPRTLRRYGNALGWVADHVGASGVLALERLATALWVTRQLGRRASVDARARALVDFKPHVPREVAVQAVQELDELVTDAKSVAA